MGGFARCCCPGCLIHEDLFSRTDGIPLRGSWCEAEGDYEIDSGRAKCLVAGAIAILNIPHPVPDESMVVSLVTVDEVENSGHKYRVLLNVDRTTSGSPVVCDAQNYYFAEFERNGLLDSVIRLGICSGGIETILKEDDILGLTSTTRTFTAVISETIFCANVSNATISLVATTHAGLFAEGYYSGFSLDTIDMVIDAFRFFQKETRSAICGTCICTCDDKEWPPVLNVRIYPDPENCLRLDLLEPCEFEIEFDRVANTWVGSGVCCGGNQNWEVEATCGGGSYGGNGFLQVAILEGCLSSCGVCESRLVEQDCGTFCATFGPLNVSASDLGCFCSSAAFDIGNPGGRGDCDYYIEVCG
jgi:hypothetical protein